MEPNNCRFNVHEFSSPLQNILAHYYVIQMKDSYFLWIGSSSAKFNNLSLALLTKYVSFKFYVRLVIEICASLYNTSRWRSVIKAKACENGLKTTTMDSY